MRKRILSMVLATFMVASLLVGCGGGAGLKHSYKKRLLAVKKCLKGFPPDSVGRELGIHPSYVTTWFECYLRDGIAGLRKHPIKRADFAEKCKKKGRQRTKKFLLLRKKEVSRIFFDDIY